VRVIAARYCYQHPGGALELLLMVVCKRPDDLRITLLFSRFDPRRRDAVGLPYITLGLSNQTDPRDPLHSPGSVLLLTP
jgi:hypothetical protein